MTHSRGQLRPAQAATRLRRQGRKLARAAHRPAARRRAPSPCARSRGAARAARAASRGAAQCWTPWPPPTAARSPGTAAGRAWARGAAPREAQAARARQRSHLAAACALRRHRRSLHLLSCMCERTGGAAAGRARRAARPRAGTAARAPRPGPAPPLPQAGRARQGGHGSAAALSVHSGNSRDVSRTSCGCCSRRAHDAVRLGEAMQAGGRTSADAPREREQRHRARLAGRAAAGLAAHRLEAHERAVQQAARQAGGHRRAEAAGQAEGDHGDRRGHAAHDHQPLRARARSRPAAWGRRQGSGGPGARRRRGRGGRALRPRRSLVRPQANEVRNWEKHQHAACARRARAQRRARRLWRGRRGVASRQPHAAERYQHARLPADLLLVQAGGAGAAGAPRGARPRAPGLQEVPDHVHGQRVGEGDLSALCELAEPAPSRSQAVGALGRCAGCACPSSQGPRPQQGTSERRQTASTAGASLTR
jgi:hypothetical protein